MGQLLLAESQTAGRGRMMREWDSSAGKGIWMTVIIRPDILPHQAPQFTLVTAVAVVNAMKAQFKNFTPEIKWPNDILINGRKTTGILTEMIAETDRVQALINWDWHKCKSANVGFSRRVAIDCNIDCD